MLVALLIACLPDSSSALTDRATLETAAAADRRPKCGVQKPCVLSARLQADIDAGSYPLEVSFASVGSFTGAGGVTYDWDFGDGAGSDLRADATHTYVGEGSFVARLTMTDRAGDVSSAEITIDVTPPSCPSENAPIVTGHVDDSDFNELSGIVNSPTDPGVFWVHEDGGNDPALIAIDALGAALAVHVLPDDFPDFEDLSIAVDPATGTPLLFLGDIGDNASARDDVAVWITEEPDLYADGDITPKKMELEYPDGPHNAETLLVDPLTLDVFIVTKEDSSVPDIYVKRAPHADGGPYVLEALGSGDELPYTATAGDISPDGSWIVVRDYGDTAYLFPRDGYLPLEDAFSGTPCEIDIHSEAQGEAIAFTADGSALVTVSEGTQEPLYRIGL